MCGYFCVRFIDFKLKGKNLLDYKNLVSRNDYDKNDKMILKYFHKLIICGKYRKFEKSKISPIFQKTLFLSLICSKCKNEDEKISKKEESIEILKILGLIENIYLLKKYESRIYMKQEIIFFKK